MVKINIIAVGKVKEKFYSDAESEYLKRLSRFCSVRTIEIPQETSLNPSKSEIKRLLDKEGEAVIKELKGYVVCLAVEGKQTASEDFAQQLKDLTASGTGVIDFVIGGSFGLSDEVKKRANLLLGFSKMTFPHTLFRVMLLEQIYRAFMINTNSTYHK